MANAAITVDLNAKIANFETELKKATGSLDRFEKKSSAVAAGIKSAFVGMAATLSVGMFVGFIKSSIDAQDELSKLSQRTGIAVESLAGLEHAAKLSDVGVEQLAKGVRTFSVTVNEAGSGLKSYQDKLAGLGLDYKKLQDLSPEDQFYALADAVNKLGKEDRAAAVAGALGDRMAVLVPLLSGGSDALRQMVEEGKKYNPVTAESARLAEEFNDNLTRLKASAGTAGVAIATDLLPPLNAFIERLMLAKAMSDAGGLFNFVVTTAGTDDLNVAMQRLNTSIADTQRAIDLGADDTFKEKLANLIAMRDVLINTRVSDILAPPATETMRRIKEERAAAAAAFAAGTADPTKTKTKPGSKADPQGAFVAKLRQEAETLGLSGEALQRYEAAKLKLAGSNKQLADSYIGQIAAFKSQQEAAKANNDAFDEAIKKQDELDAALEGSIKSVREWIVQQEYEVSLIGMTNSERETAIQMRALETAGVDTQTEAYKRLAAQVAAANADKRGISLLSGTQTEKTKEFLTDIEAMNKLFFDGAIGAQQYAEGIDLITGNADAVDDRLKKANDTAKELGMTFTSAFENAIVKGNKFKDVLKGLAEDLLRIMAREAVVKPLANWAGNFAASMFANGGVMSAGGSLPLNKYASGGIANSPQLAVFGEGSMNEAYVPLPDGRSIPVTLKGGGGVTVQNNYTIDARGADQGAEQRIRRAMAETEDRAVARSVTQVQSMNQRGQLRLA